MENFTHGGTYLPDIYRSPSTLSVDDHFHVTYELSRLK